MNTYGQYCPIAKASEIVADRWTPLIVRELLYGAHRFNELDRGLPGISRALLVQRLRRLEHAGVVERRVHEREVAYHLTPAGRELERVLDVLGEWGARWAFDEPTRDELDPVLLLWFVRRRIAHEHLPQRRVVVQFDFRGAQRRTLWLVLEPGDASMCLQHPGYDVDLLVSADLAAFYRVWFGRSTWAEAMAEGTITLDGPTALVRAYPTWMKLSHFAPVVRTAARSPRERGARPARAARDRRIAS